MPSLYCSGAWRRAAAAACVCAHHGLMCCGRSRPASAMWFMYATVCQPYDTQSDAQACTCYCQPGVWFLPKRLACVIVSVRVLPRRAANMFCSAGGGRACLCQLRQLGCVCEASSLHMVSYKLSHICRLEGNQLQHTPSHTSKAICYRHPFGSKHAQHAHVPVHTCCAHRHASARIRTRTRHGWHGQPPPMYIIARNMLSKACRHMRRACLRALYVNMYMYR